MHTVAMLAFAVTVVLPLTLQRRALERHPPGPARERLQGLAAVCFVAGLNFVAQAAYLLLCTMLLG